MVAMESAESELESFRQRWREEVSARQKQGRSQLNPATNVGISDVATRPGEPRNRSSAVQRVQTDRDAPIPLQSGPGRPKVPKIQAPQNKLYHDDHDTYTPTTFQDIDSNKEDTLKLGYDGVRADRAQAWDATPRSALEHYEKAVEKEAEGRLGDSVRLYRKALKMDPRAHEVYKNKHFPPSAFANKPPASTASKRSADATSPVTVTELNKQAQQPALTQTDSQGPPDRMASLEEMLEDFARCSITAVLPLPDSPLTLPCPISELPEELLQQIYMTLAISDVASFARLAQVCKRFAYSVVTEERIWKRITFGHEFGMAAMRYSYATDFKGKPLLEASTSEQGWVPYDLTPSVYSTYRAQFRHRPRIRFNGCYISTVNYTRPGGASESQLSWNCPIHIVTYYRYLRFFRDGTLISLLTTAEPNDVVHHLIPENVHRTHGHHGTQTSGGGNIGSGASGGAILLPSAAMKDALRGRWRLSGLPSVDDVALNEAADLDRVPGTYVREAWDAESEGDVLVETEGVVPKYMWKMQFTMGSSGRRAGARNNKLAWKAFWSYNVLTGDWGEFRLKNEKAFYFSRVKSYGMGE